jgi:hypothetical protein
MQARGMSTVPETQRLSQLVAEKRDCLEQLLRLSEQQLSLIDEGRMTDLLNVLAAKQRLLSALSAVERLLAPFREQDPAARRWRAAADRVHCGELLADCERLLARALEREREGEARLRARRDETAAQLRGAQGAAAAHALYSAEQRTAPRRLDLSTEA